MKISVGLSAVLSMTLLGPPSQAADIGAPHGNAGLVESPCYAVFHELPDGQGYSLEVQGPLAVPAIRRVFYSNGATLNRRVMSVTTGSAAKLTLYDASRFRAPMFEVGPDSRVNLARPVMDSYELRCTAPPALPAYTPPPGYK